MAAINQLCRRVILAEQRGGSRGRAIEHVAGKYLAESLNGTGSREEVWDTAAEAPGNDIVRLHRVRVRPENSHLSDSLTMETPFLVEIEYWNLLADANLNVTLHVYTEEGLVAFTTGSMKDSPLPVGLIRAVCYLPGNLLNSGLHRLVVLIVKDTSSVICSHESAVSFDILDLREREGTCYGREPGVVQPILKWAREYIGEGPK